MHIQTFKKSQEQLGKVTTSLMENVSIIIPAFNEEKRIGQTISDLVNNAPGILEIIVIFDGNDQTERIAVEAGKNVKVIRFSQRLGQGGAVFEGFKHAKGDVVCFIDADGATPWYEIIRICSLVNKNRPVVYGSRWVQGSKIGRKENIRNIVGGRIYHYLALAILGVHEKDSFCGLKAFDRVVALKLAKRVTLSDRTFNIAISYNLKLMGIRISEVGVEWFHKDGTKLHVGLKVIIMMFLTLIGLRIVHCVNCKKLKQFVVNFRTKIHFY
jgi:glycosyltransferase involved in cell wall biosynthesis